MSTHSYICVDCGDKIRGSYCHYDGYLQGVGHTLLHRYKDFALICELISAGGFRSLQESVDLIEYFDDEPYIEYSSESGLIESAIDYDIDYIYLFKDNTWFVTSMSEDGDFVPLEEAIKNVKD